MVRGGGVVGNVAMDGEREVTGCLDGNLKEEEALRCLLAPSIEMPSRSPRGGEDSRGDGEVLPAVVMVWL